MRQSASPKTHLNKKRIYTIMIIVCAAAFCFSLFMILKILYEYWQGDYIYNNINSQVTTDTNITHMVTDDNDNSYELEIPFKYNHEELVALNPDGVGYLYIPSIDLRLPLAQAWNNSYYLQHTFTGEENEAGSLFLDCGIKNGLRGSNVIIYGHNRQNESMFGKLDYYEDYDFYNKPGNNLIYVYTEDSLLLYRIFSVHISEQVAPEVYSFNFSTKEQLIEYAMKMKELSMYETNADVSNVNQVLTLSTCTDQIVTRFLIHASLVLETRLPD